MAEPSLPRGAGAAPAKTDTSPLEVHAVRDLRHALEGDDILRDTRVFDNFPQCLVILDPQGSLLFMNGPGQRAMEIDEVRRHLNAPWVKLWAHRCKATLEAMLQDARDGKPSDFTLTSPTMQGKERWWEVAMRPLARSGGEETTRILVVLHDVSALKQTQLLLERARNEAEAAAAQLSAVLESTTDSVILLDRNLAVTYVNTRAREMLRASGIENLFRDPQAYRTHTADAFRLRYLKVIETQQPMSFEDYSDLLGRQLEVHLYPTRDGVSLFFRDVTARQTVERERREAKSRIDYLAQHDVLTGLANRGLFRERLEAALLRTPAAEVAVIYVDLHGFKSVNDALGHSVGDALLLRVAQRLQGCTRRSEILARLGADEFGIVQADVKQPESATVIAGRITEALTGRYEIEGNLIEVAVSAGIALTDVENRDADRLLTQADIALSYAKQDGRGTWRFFENDMNAALLARHTIRQELRHALARGEFWMAYQPLINLASLEVVGFEALLRWNHPQLGAVPVADFIPIAEQDGLIGAIGAMVLQTVCREAARWPKSLKVAANLSPVQFRERNLAQTVSTALATSGLAPDRLELEITEAVLLRENEANLAILTALRQTGIKIALDDFGTGYSSLSYLRGFQIDKIKIDRSFVDELPVNRECRAIVSALAGLANELSIVTTAEGVETEAQLTELQTIGCSEAQGYLISRPMPADEIAGFLAGYDALKRRAFPSVRSRPQLTS
jgi:diguanylate cyclase (GGDEF)-like protein